MKWKYTKNNEIPSPYTSTAKWSRRHTSAFGKFWEIDEF